MIYLSNPEYLAIQLALGRILEEINGAKNNQRIPWNCEARGTLQEILTAARSAASKIERVTGISVELPPFVDGDEEAFLTKES